MEALAVQLSRRLFSLDSATFFGLLNAVYRFADFLQETKSMSPERSAAAQQTCRTLFEEGYPILCQQGIETRARAKFPPPGAWSPPRLWDRHGLGPVRKDALKPQLKSEGR